MQLSVLHVIQGSRSRACYCRCNGESYAIMGVPDIAHSVTTRFRHRCRERGMLGQCRNANSHVLAMR